MVINLGEERKMKMISYIGVGVFLSVFVTSTLAQDWQVVYQTDFSTNPNWITNNATNNYWNSTGQNYHTKTFSNGGQYAYVSVPFVQGNSYKLEFDLSVANVDYHGGCVRLGLGDSDMAISAPATFFVGYWNSGSGGANRGNVLGEFYSNSQGDSYHPGMDPITFFSTNTWYHNVLTYDYSNATLSLTVTNKSSGSLLGTQFKTGVGTFLGINRLYISSISNDGDTGLAGEGYIDNLVLSTVPEPVTLLLLGVGGILLRRKQ
jgi:hypothetical protein